MAYPKRSLSTLLLVLVIPLTVAAPSEALNKRAANACSNIVYAEVKALLGNYQPALQYCSANFPVSCTTAGVLTKRAVPLSTTKVTTSSSVTTTTSKSATTTTPKTSASKTSAVDPQQSMLSSLLSNAAKAFVSTACSCIETPTACKASTTTTTTSKPTSTTTTVLTTTTTTTTTVPTTTTTTTTTVPTTTTTTTTSSSPTPSPLCVHQPSYPIGGKNYDTECGKNFPSSSSYLYCGEPINGNGQPSSTTNIFECAAACGTQQTCPYGTDPTNMKPNAAAFLRSSQLCFCYITPSSANAMYVTDADHDTAVQN